MTEEQARNEICRVGASLFARGYVHATAGNISVRLQDGTYLITPTDTCLGTLVPEKLAHLAENLQQLSGDKASKTITLHSRIYAANQAIQNPISCVIHTHSTHCVALSLQPQAWQTSLQTLGQELLPALTPYFVMKVGHVPLIPYQRPGAPESAEAVAQTITAYGSRAVPLRAVMLERLGPNVWHQSPAAAMAVLEELEETAKLFLLTQQNSHPPTHLNENQIQQLRQSFGAIW